ncbi:MAG: metallophosphoesterase family protein [Chloroflexota bacterium]
MKIAIFADIHGNLPAFEAAIDHAHAQHVDHIVIAGDIVVGAPDSAACWRLAKQLNCPIVRGNHERYVAHYGTDKGDPQWHTLQFAPVRWGVEQFSDEERREIDNLPLYYSIAEAPDILVVHSSLRNDRDTLISHTPADEQLSQLFPDAMMPNPDVRIIVRGHNHIQQVRFWDERLIVTAGSVGLPLDDHVTAQYLILEKQEGEGHHQTGWHIHHQSVAYDVETVLARFRETNYLAEAGPIGYLFMRELATASPQMVPFLRRYGRWRENEEISLEDALARFMGVDGRGL